MISIIFSILSGVTIVLSRSVNGMLSKKIGALLRDSFIIILQAL